MNKQFFGLFAFLLAFLFSCSDDNLNTGKKEGMVDFTIETSIPKEIATYASHEGGIANVDPGYYSLRYIMEVWTQDNPRQLAYRDSSIVTDFNVSTNVTFSVQLVSQVYDFVFWADFVDKGTKEDKFYNTNSNNTSFADLGYLGLQDIQIKSYEISTEARDAFYAAEKNVDLSHSNHIGVKLTRPFGKYRLIATEAPSGSVGEVTVDYSAMALPVGFNALTGDITSVTILATTCTGEASPEIAEAGGITYPNAYVLAFDYIFVPESVPQTVKFNATVYDGTAAAGASIGYFEIPDILVERNKLTTVIGNFFTN